MSSAKECDDAGDSNSRKYEFRLAGDDVKLTLEETLPRNLVLGFQETTSSHGVPHVHQARGKSLLHVTYSTPEFMTWRYNRSQS